MRSARLGNRREWAVGRDWRVGFDGHEMSVVRSSGPDWRFWPTEHPRKFGGDLLIRPPPATSTDGQLEMFCV